MLLLHGDPIGFSPTVTHKKTFTYHLFPYNFHTMIFRETVEENNDLIRQIALENGLTVNVFDKTQRYFGDYHHVRLEIVCEVPVPEDDPAVSFGARSCRYTCDLRRMGVPSADVPAVIEELLSGFSATTLAYLSSPSFPERFVRAQESRQPSPANMKFSPGF